MNTLTITLKQHTPLIHFQHEQDGATLRATEVKPKLDRFILTKLGNGDIEKGKAEALKNEWIIKGQEKALDYKMRIMLENVQQVKMPVEKKMVKREYSEKIQDTDENGNPLFVTTFPFILSNMGGKIESDIINFSFSNRLNLTISSFKESLLKQINSHIIEFFMLNNFGQRNNKGFGSFSVTEKNGTIIEFSDKYFDDSVQFLEFKLQMVKKDIYYFKKIFEVVDYYWKRLKPGVNYSFFDKETKKMQFVEYEKSFLFKYLNDIYKKTWEKAKIKETFNLGKSDYDNRNQNLPVFGRALLGMPDKFEYGSKGTVTISHSEIERIMAPIIFKPIIDGDTISIFVLVKDEHIQIIKQNTKEFEFSKDGQTMTLPLNFTIDYVDLLKKFQEYFIKENKNPEFYPVSFNGNNILGKNNTVNIYYYE